MAHLTPKATADRLGITTRWLAELAKAGCVPKTGKGRNARHPWPGTRKAYDEYLARKAVEALGPLDLKKERAALIRVQRKTAELDLRRKQAELVTATDAAAESARLVEFVRARLLNLPGRFGPQLVGIQRVDDAVAKLDTAVREVMSGLIADADELKQPPTRKTRTRRPAKPRKSSKRVGRPARKAG